MKRIAPVLTALAVLTFALVGSAQGSGRASTPTTTKTADYVERSVEGDQIVTFTGDELVGPVGGQYGDVMRRPPGIIRVLLIRPRMNFVPELLKNVENL